LKISQAVQGFLQYKAAEALSPRTIEGYQHDLQKWIEHIGNVDVAKISAESLRAYLVWLHTEYKPRRFNGNTEPLSPKTINNIWVSLSAFFNWYSREFDLNNPMKTVPAPKFEEKPVEPYSKEEVDALLKACDTSREVNSRRRANFTMRRSTYLRDRAILLTLLDTGLRASEICSLIIGDVDFKSGKVQIRHGVQGGAKGGKGRTVYLGKVARNMLWRYLVTRDDKDDMAAPLFDGKFRHPLNRNALRRLLSRLGEKAKVLNCHPHRFRHTFAITYLRSGGDVFTLQSQLGHSTLEMVQHYARIAQIDVEQAHRKASPADNWRL